MATTDEGRLVEAARSGDQQAFGRLFDEWFDRVHDLSRRIVRDREVAAEVAQDAFLKAWTRLDTLDDVDAFGGWLLRIARNASLNRLDKERRSTAFDDETLTMLTDLDPDDTDPLADLDRAEQIDLVWAAAEALGPRDLSVLDLHLRHGLGAGEIAEELGTNRNNAHQILHTLRDRLATNMRSLVLWRAGRPSCPELRSALSDQRSAGFDKRTVKIIDRHADVCVDCGRERTDRLSPAALFGAAPVVAAPILLRSQAAAGLEAAGVPMSGSSALSAGPAGSEGSTAPTGPGPAGPTGPTGPAGSRSTEPSEPSETDGEDGPERRTRRRALAVMVVLAAVFGGVGAWIATAGGDDVVEPVIAPTSLRPTTSVPTTAGATSSSEAVAPAPTPSETAPGVTDPVVTDPPSPTRTDEPTVTTTPDPTPTTTAVPGQGPVESSTTFGTFIVEPPLVLPTFVITTTTTPVLQ